MVPRGRDDLESGPKSHIVPVQMIRRFANESGRLFCLRKDTLVIAERTYGNLPRDILYRRHYYKGKRLDLDNEWLKPRESAFASLYPRLADDDAEHIQLNAADARVFVQWLVALQSRSELMADAVAAMNSANYIQECSGVIIDDNELAYLLMVGYAEQLESIYNSSGWRWKLLVLRQGRSMVLSDHPVGHTTIVDPLGSVVFLPLSKEWIIVGGTRDTLEKLKSVTVDQINLFAASWANRLIYGSSVEELEYVAAQLRKANEAARLPFYGVTQRMRTDPDPHVHGLADRSVFDLLKDVIKDADR